MSENTLIPRFWLNQMSHSRKGSVTIRGDFQMATKTEPTETGSASNDLLCTVGRKLFEFSSEIQWVNKGRSWYANCGVRESRRITIDAKGRIVVSSREFMRATKDDAYPVSVYEID